MVDVTTPNGNHRRWARDERRPENVPANMQFGSTIPGGFDSFTCTLPRRAKISYDDTKRLSNVRVMGVGGQVAWEGRLESAPRVAGNDAAVTPGAVGWQAHLDDDTSAAMIYVSRDLSGWGSPSAPRRVAHLASNETVFDPSVGSDASTGLPALQLAFSGAWASPHLPICEAWYDGGPACSIASIYYDPVQVGTNPGAGSTRLFIGVSSDNIATTVDQSADLFGVLAVATFTPATARRFAYCSWDFTTTAAGADGETYGLNMRRLTIWGNHGLTKRGTAPADGLYASDIVAHAVRTWAPLLKVSTGANGSVTDTSFIIPQAEFREPTTAGQIISAANRYHLRDWAVWENRCFYYYDRGARGKSWRARVAPAQLEEAGPDTAHLWNGTIVVYQDVDGTTKRVGPTGSGADTISTSVMDTDPLNPANELGIRRWAILDMNGVSTAAGATEVGRRFLIETAQYNTSGRAQIVGHAEDDRGVIHPYWRVRAGDTISFVDASYTEPRRIVRTSCDDSSKTNSIDLDAPAEGLEALLQRLQVVLVGVL